MNNKWAKLTNSHWVHPDIGYIKYIGNDYWEITPKPFLAPPKVLHSEEECFKYGEDIYSNYLHWDNKSKLNNNMS